MRIHIKNGHVIDPANKIDSRGDLFIADGKIASVFKYPDGYTADLTIDAGNHLVCPGLIDLCARFREPGQEHKATIDSEVLAATSAGITAVCCPPDTDPVIDTPAVAELIYHRTEVIDKTRIYPLGAMTHALAGERLAEMQTLKAAGCIGVSNANHPIQNSEVLRRAMEYAASFNLTIHLFAEDNALRNNGVVHEGIISTRLGLPAIPTSAETVAVSRALLLVEQTGAKTHFCRLSSARSIEMIAQAKTSGLPVTADVGICHLHLTEMDVDGFNTDCHLVPPLRTQSDKEALQQSLAMGIVDVICSDHQPHDTDAKNAPFSDTQPGASTLEFLLPLTLNLVDKNIITLVEAIACLTVKPAEIMGIAGGSLAVGSSADIAIVDLHKQWTVDPANMLSKGKNTPFAGWQLNGKVTHTLLNGKIIYQPAM